LYRRDEICDENFRVEIASLMGRRNRMGTKCCSSGWSSRSIPPGENKCIVRNFKIQASWVDSMATMSAGILMYRHADDGLSVLLVHPGGPFWRNRDLGAWSIPKGEFDASEDAEIAARREFEEELGVEANGTLLPLGEIRQRS